MKTLVIALWAFSIIFICYYIDQRAFGVLFPAVTLSFLGYLLLVSQIKPSFKLTLTLGVMLRVALIPAFPLLSDDIYRYLWDGLTWWHGFDAYSLTPAQAAEIIQRPDLLSKMNSPNYHAIYPPFVQVLFAILAKLTGGNLMLFSLALKASLLLVEVGIMYQLMRLSIRIGSGHLAHAWYFLNPLVIVETSGNAHFEVIMLLLTLVAVNLFIKRQYWASGMSLASGVLIKFMPLLLLPAFIFRKLDKAWQLLLGLTMTLVAGMIPVILWLKPTMGLIDSLDLFVRKFEFNPSLYALARELGTLWIGYNPIQWVGPGLTFIAGCLILTLAWKHRLLALGQWPALLAASFVIHLLFATTVHPWYIILPLGLSVLAGQTYLLVWSYLIFLSYSFYSGYPSEYLIAIQYFLLLGYMIWKKESPLHLRTTGP